MSLATHRQPYVCDVCWHDQISLERRMMSRRAELGYRYWPVEMLPADAPGAAS